MSLTKQYELERVTAALKEAEDRLFDSEVALEEVNKSLIFLHHLERQLAENIEILRRQTIITLAPEYRKIRDELGKVRQKQCEIKKEQREKLKSLSNAQILLKQMQSHYDNVIERLEDNVIHVDFGRGNGREG